MFRRGRATWDTAGTFRDEYTGCRPINATLLPDNSLASEDLGLQGVLAGDWRNQAANPVMRELGIPVLHTWNWTLPLWEYHHNYNRRGKSDCTHVCHPSAYEVTPPRPLFLFCCLLSPMVH